MLTHFVRKQGILRFGKTKLERQLFRDIIVHGLPEGISQLATPVMTFCMNKVLIEKVGDLGVNAFSIICYVASFSMAVFLGTSEGLQPLFGQSYGAKNEKDLRFYFKSGLGISFFGSIIITAIAVFLRRHICTLFGADLATQEYIFQVLSVFVAGFITMAVNVMISSYLYSTERSFQSTIISVLRSIIVSTAVILLLPHIYSYFVQGHNAQECVQFLRDAYGDGGSSYTGYDEWHDSKGIKFTRQDDESGFKGYATIRLNWN